MEISLIEAFDRVARDGTFTRAADSLGLTQPAVSARIAALETQLGGPVFEREGRQLTLTPLGQRFLPYAQRMLAVLADGLQDARDFHAGKRGEVRIAAPGPFVLGFLLDTLVRFHTRHPGVDVLIRERNKTAVIEMLYDNNITLGLVNAPIYDRRIVQMATFQDPIRAVAAPQHPLAAQHAAGGLAMETLYAYTIFRVSMFPEMTAFMDSVAEQGRAGSGGAVLAVPMVMALRLAVMGQGVTFLPESYVRSSVTAGELITLHIHDMEPLISRPVLVAHRGRQLDAVHRAFIEILVNCWRPLLERSALA